MKWIVIVFAPVILSGCATHPVTTSQATATKATKWGSPKEGYGTLIVKRDSGFLGKACSAGVYVDGERVGSLGTSEKVTVYLPPGEHLIGARNGTICGGAVSETAVVLTAQGHKTYRIAISDGGDIKIQPTAF